MARILYGVHGTGHGHAMRALAVARHYPRHVFQFVSHGEGSALLRHEFPVVECPNPETPIRAHGVDSLRALRTVVKTRLQQSRRLRDLRDLMDRFQPDVAITDYEYFVPRAARLAGLPCVSLDHQHVVTFGRYPLPWRAWPGYVFTVGAIRGLFTCADEYLVTSFFQPETKPGAARVQFAPPLLRGQVFQHKAVEGDHVLAYQGYSTFRGFVPFLRRLGRPVRVYGLGSGGPDGSLDFRAPHEARFLEDLATCRYVVCGGGHTLISEALFFGKPVVSIPIRHAFEQFVNASEVTRRGYGLGVGAARLGALGIGDLEARLEACRPNVRAGNFRGNEEIFASLDRFITSGTLWPAERPRN